MHSALTFESLSSLVCSLFFQPVCFWFQVSFDRVNKAEDGTESVKHVKRMLYHRMNVLPQKKVMTFNRHTDDFQFHASYTDLDFLNEEEKR